MNHFSYLFELTIAQNIPEDIPFAYLSYTSPCPGGDNRVEHHDARGGQDN